MINEKLFKSGYVSENCISFSVQNKKHGSPYSFGRKSPFTCFQEISPSENLHCWPFSHDAYHRRNACIYNISVKVRLKRKFVLYHWLFREHNTACMLDMHVGTLCHFPDSQYYFVRQ